MQVLGIIPARYESSRFPGKPLVDLAGKSMIQRVYEQCSKAESLDAVVVATDDDRIASAVAEFGGKAIMTSSTHRTGTERCNEALTKAGKDFDVVINIQGDEPLIHPGQINKVAELFQDTATEIGTLARPLEEQDRNNPNTVKVVRTIRQFALYFSRSRIPFDRTGSEPQYLQHVGIYGYRSSALRKLVELAPTPLEIAESLEQLRWLENGYRIKVDLTDLSSVGVDTPEDVARILELLDKAGS